MQTVQKTEIRQVQFLDWETPVVVQRQARMVQTVQSGGAAGAVPPRLWSQDVPEFRAKPGGASDSVHRKSWAMTAVKRFLAHFAPFFALLRLSGVERQFSQLGALDDEEFFVIEGSCQ